MWMDRLHKNLILWIVLLVKSNIYASEISSENKCLSIIPFQDTKIITQEEVYQHTVSSSFKIQQRDLILNPFPNSQKRLIVVTGISCAGKSSLCKALKKFGPHISLLEYDTFLKETIYSFLNSFKKQGALPGIPARKIIKEYKENKV